MENILFFGEGKPPSSRYKYTAFFVQHRFVINFQNMKYFVAAIPTVGSIVWMLSCALNCIFYHVFKITSSVKLSGEKN